MDFGELSSFAEVISKKRMHCTARNKSNRNSIFHSVGERELASLKSLIMGFDENQFNMGVFREFLSKVDAEEGQVAMSRLQRGVGAFLGMVLGDYLGAPIEFLEATNKSESIRFDDTIAEGFEYTYVVRNVFQLQTGQWTDDAAMGACIADSLLVHGHLNGRDIRSRFWNWWSNGYNNAFLYSKHRSPFQSVGLGGNIAKSIAAINGKKYREIPPKYNSKTQDSGNGGLMRLAAVPVFFSNSSVEEVMFCARESSETTHPGDLASRCAEFMAYVIFHAINREEDLSDSGSDGVAVLASDFLDRVVASYLRDHCSASPATTTLPAGTDSMRRLLLSNEPSHSTELCWNWRTPVLLIEECARNRGPVYNGYPNDLGYFGSFCMDGLAIALNAFRHGTSFEHSLKICIDYRGDADSTGSITGQIAGAFYGATAISPQLISNTVVWDKGENVLRAVMLTPWYQRLCSASQTLRTPPPSSPASPSHSSSSVVADGAEDQGEGVDVDRLAKGSIGMTSRQRLKTTSSLDNQSQAASSSSAARGLRLGSGSGSWMKSAFSYLRNIVGMSPRDGSAGGKSAPVVPTPEGLLWAAGAGDVVAFISSFHLLAAPTDPTDPTDPSDPADPTLGQRCGVDAEELLMQVDGNGWTCLQLAAGKGHVAMILEILSLARGHRASTTQTLVIKGDRRDENPTMDVASTVVSGETTVVDRQVLETTDDGEEADAEEDTLFKRLLDFKGESNVSAVLLALANGFDVAASILIKAGASLEGEVSRGRNAAFLMARNDLVGAAEAVLSRDRTGDEELRRVAEMGDRVGYNALMAAAISGSVRMCALLLRLGVGVGHKARDRSTALHLACRSLRVSPSPPTSTSTSTFSASLISSTSSSPGVSASVQVLSMLLPRCGVEDLTAADNFGSSPLHTAALNANVGAIDCIMRRGLSLDGVSARDLVCHDDDGMHPTHAACQELLRCVQALSALQSESASISTEATENGDGGIKGVSKKRKEMATDENSASANASGSEGILSEADTERAQMLKRIDNCKECIRTLLLLGYPLDRVDFGNATILHVLCWGVGPDQLEMITFVIDLIRTSAVQSGPDGASVSAVEGGEHVVEAIAENGWSCLHVAASTGGTCAVEALDVLKGVASSSFLRTFDPSLPRSSDNSAYLMRRGPHNRIPEEERKDILRGDYTLRGVVARLRSLPHTPRVVVLAGAGMSTSCGIKDFRSPDGLYADKTTANMFSTEFLMTQPEAFYERISAMFLPVIDKRIKPSPAHAFVRLLRDMGWLQRLYTQNIDMLEYYNDLLSPSDVVECHGSCRHAYCTSSQCRVRLVSKGDMETHFWAPVRAGATPLCSACGSFLRPDVTFFGEPMPDAFEASLLGDARACDLLLVVGTSLSVYPVAAIPQMVEPGCVRVLLNRDGSGCFQHVQPTSMDAERENEQPLAKEYAGGGEGGGVGEEQEGIGGVQSDAHLGSPSSPRWSTSAYRDVFEQGSVDEGAWRLARCLDKVAELQAIVGSFET